MPETSSLDIIGQCTAFSANIMMTFISPLFCLPILFQFLARSFTVPTNKNSHFSMTKYQLEHNKLFNKDFFISSSKCVLLIVNKYT